MVKETRLRVIEKELAMLDEEVKENEQQQQRLARALGVLSEREAKLRAEAVFIKKLLCAHPWRYVSDCYLSGEKERNFPGLCDTLCRFNDYHAGFMLDKGVELVLSDGEVSIRFLKREPGWLAKRKQGIEEPESTKEKMCKFVKKWGIVISFKDLEEKRNRVADELSQIDLLLNKTKDLR